MSKRNKLRRLTIIRAMCLVLVALAVATAVHAVPFLIAAQKENSTQFQVPPGWVVEEVAAQPLVNYPLFACFDDAGRLYVAEGTGKNLPGTELVKLNLGKITRLEDVNGDGKFDRAMTFADGLVFPQGVLWHDGAVYAASHPAIWRFEDTDGDGRADTRQELVGKFGFNGNGCDIHGPFLGPDGWLYWTDGRHGYECTTKEGEKLEGLAARIFRCRPDGSGIERIAGGGFDNPVELVWTSTGELLGTMDQGPGDCILHYVEGGVYPRDDQPCLKEFTMTGPLLPPVTMFSAALPVALCGMSRITTDHFGPEYRDVLLTAQFNVHRIQQHHLVPEGSTFRAINKDFLVSGNYDCHPSDILEDGDGSLLLVDMGAWFNYGCPTAKIAKPEVKGKIYRVRRAAAPAIGDPWGKSIAWDSLSPAELTGLLDDPRAKVRERAIHALSNASDRAVPALASVAHGRGAETGGANVSVEARQNAIWALCRMDTPAARAEIRRGVLHPQPMVQHVAIHAAGLLRDRDALSDLAATVLSDDLTLRRRAAEAIGRLGDPRGVPAIIASLQHGVKDRFLEHALIYALIQMNHRAATLPALDDPNPHVRRAALIALDQMPGGGLTREIASTQLDTDDPELQRAAVEIFSRREGWAAELNRLIRQWLAADRPLETSQRKSLVGALLAAANEPSAQDLVAESLGNNAVPLETRLLLVQVIARSRLERLPDSWSKSLAQLLGASDTRRLQAEAISAVRTRGLKEFDTALAAIGQDTELGAEQRVAALLCIAPRQRLANSVVDFLMTQLDEQVEPLQQVTAARAIGSSSLSRDQLLAVARSIERAGPLLVPLLLPAFAKQNDVKIGHALVAALARSPGLNAVAADDLREALKAYPADVLQAAEPLLRQIASRHEEQQAYLSKLTLDTLQHSPVPERGRDVFFSKKVGCYGCHKLDGRGGSAGPDLSLIGRIRDPRALLEAIVFPSSTIVPDYRQFVVATNTGSIHTGMIARDDSDAIYLRTTELAEIRVARSEVADVKESSVSLMPQGLEKTMTAQELSDLLEFLYQRR